MSLADTRLARLLFLLLSGLGNSRMRLASGSRRCCYRQCSCLLSKGAGLDVGIGVGSLRDVCGGGRGGPEWLSGGLS